MTRHINKSFDCGCKVRGVFSDILKAIGKVCTMIYLNWNKMVYLENYINCY